MNVEVYDHAVERYIHRIFGIDEEEATEIDSKVAEKEIISAIKYPDRVIDDGEDKPQIHIKRNAAVIVGVESGEDEKYSRYGSLEDDLVVPSVYQASVFGGASDDDKRRARA